MAHMCPGMWWPRLRGASGRRLLLYTAHTDGLTQGASGLAEGASRLTPAPRPAPAGLAQAAAEQAAAAAPYIAEQAAAAAAAAPYVPSPYQPGWEIWAGAFFGTFPFVIASIEFGKRIVIQRRCPECRGKGLVPASGPAGRKGRLRKCPQCGGMLPWGGWKLFLFSSSPGNGGPLLQPMGQRSVLYKVPPRPPQQQQEEAGAGRRQSPPDEGGS